MIARNPEDGFRVIVTSAGGNVGQGVIKALADSKHPFHVIAVDMEPLSAGFHMAAHFSIVPRTSDRNFYGALKPLCRKYNVQAVFVCSPQELAPFDKLRSRIETDLGAKVLMNPGRVLEIGSDKYETYKFLVENGFPAPRSVLASDSGEYSAFAGDVGFPLIAKPRRGQSSEHVHLIHDMEGLQRICGLVPDAVIQEYIDVERNEYTATTVSDRDGVVRACIVLRRDLLQGTTYRSEVVQDNGITSQIWDIMNALRTQGSCNIQFRLKEGIVYPFEINPRFSGTAGIRFRHGFNDAEMVFLHFCMNEEILQPQLRKGVTLRYWDEIFVPDEDFESLTKYNSRKGR